MRSIVECIAGHAKKNPETLCLVDIKEEKTYAEFFKEVEQMAGFLSQYVDSGECIVIEAVQRIPYLAVEMALHLLHGVFVPLERKCAAARILSIGEETKAKLIISDQKLDTEIPVLTYEALMECCASAEPLKDYTFPEEEEIAEILFSTGTTGKPKGILISHGNDIALAENVKYGVEMKAQNMEIVPVPLNHSHGLRTCYANFFNGSGVILMDGLLNIKKFFWYLDNYPVTGIDLVPSSLSIVFKLSKDKLGEYKDQLDYIQLGAAPLLEEDKVTLCRLLPDTRLYNFYGSTESGRCCVFNFNAEQGKKGCIGKPAHNASFLFVDDDRNPINPATKENPGLLAIKGAMNMIAYYHDTEETKKVTDGTYIYTSDIAYMEDGDVYLLGRKGDVINVGGNKVSPNEIESVAKTFDGVEDCACIPVEDSIKGFVPKLFIETSKDVDEKELSAYLASQMEPYKVPKFIVKIDAIPRTYNGKIDKKELKKL